MKPNYKSLQARNSALLLRHNPSSATIIFFTLLTIGRITLSQQNYHYHNHGPVLDEEITLDSVHEYEKSPIDQTNDATQVNHDKQASKVDSNYHEAGQQSPTLSLPDQNDPFAVTFEEYLKDWFTNNPNHRAANHASGGEAVADKADLIIEEDENLVKPKESIPNIDYIFPAPRQEPMHRQQQHEAGLITPQDNKDLKSNSALEEIRLLFAWKQLPTNKCSKTCGKGLRVHHISCIDLKFNVRVEDELCHQSNLPRPSETSDEPCNEIDCPAEWLSIESHRCDPISLNIDCQPKLYKRAQCSMINKFGSLVYLDESRCNSTKSSLLVQEDSHDEGVKKEISGVTALGNENIDTNSEELILNNDDSNDIASNLDSTETFESLLNKISRSSNVQPQDDPYFFTGNWSECSGASCGQIGKRTRLVTCRLNLSGQSSTSDLPSHRCKGQTVPFDEEPCYIHCPETPEHNANSSLQNFELNSDSETIYDQEMTRFTWKTGGWTKCSADCLGGRRESIMECWDKTTESVVDHANCDSGTKPPVITETCNDIPCPAEWRVGLWSRCTKQCGSAGTRTRTVSCAQQVPMREGITYMVVSNDLCISVNASVPTSSESCNRVDCKPEWSVGPWSECSKKCGEGVRNRTLICMQEFATKEGPKSGRQYANRAQSSDLLEAIAIGSKDWHPGKAVQVPFEECYEEYKTAPLLEELCFNFCDKEPYIDADLLQNYRMGQEFTKKKTVTLKVGGKAQVFEGRNLKIRCKILNRQRSDNLVTKVLDQVEWRKDGIRIFMNNSTMSEKHYTPDDNSILGRDVFTDDRNQFMADEPKQKRASTGTHSQTKARHLNVRSWNNHHGSLSEPQGSFNFSPQPGGRFALVRESTLRIKRLRPDDSGTYTCYYGALSESLNLKVVGRRDLSNIDASDNSSL